MWAKGERKVGKIAPGARGSASPSRGSSVRAAHSPCASRAARACGTRSLSASTGEARALRVLRRDKLLRRDRYCSLVTSNGRWLAGRTWRASPAASAPSSSHGATPWPCARLRSCRPSAWPAAAARSWRFAGGACSVRHGYYCARPFSGGDHATTAALIRTCADHDLDLSFDSVRFGHVFFGWELGAELEKFSKAMGSRWCVVPYGWSGACPVVGLIAFRNFAPCPQLVAARSGAQKTRAAEDAKNAAARRTRRWPPQLACPTPHAASRRPPPPPRPASPSP